MQIKEASLIPAVKKAAKKGGKKAALKLDLTQGMSSSSAQANPYERKPIGLFKPLDYLNRGQYMVLNPLRRLTDPKKDYSIGEIAKSSVAGLLGKERSETADVLENFGWKPKTLPGKIARGTVGLVGDILLDPTTYIPIANLTKAGKAAKAGALIKIGKHTLDMRKEMPKVIKLVGEELASKGAKADDIAKFTKELGGIVSETAAKDLVEALRKKSISAKAVELAPNMLQQFKQGQRALLQFELPRIFGGASTRIPIPQKAEKKLWGAASNLGRKVKAGRVLADKEVLEKMSEGAKAVVKKRGADYKGIGATANKIAETFNLIATPIKKATRFARGYSNVKVEEGMQEINKLLGGNSEKLYRGAKPFTDSIGGTAKAFTEADDIAARLEFIGGLRHPAVQEALAQKIGKLTTKDGKLTTGFGHLDYADWDKITLEDIADSLEDIRSGSLRATTNQTNNALRESIKSGKAASFVLPSGERVDRMKNTALRWGDKEAIRDIVESLNVLEGKARELGAIKGSQIQSQIMTSGSGYIPFILDEGFSSFYDPKLRHHGQTIFEALHGVRDPEIVRNLIENSDAIYKYGKNGEPLTGIDILFGKSGASTKFMGNEFTEEGKKILSAYRNLAEVAQNPNSTMEQVNKAYNELLKFGGEAAGKDIFKTNARAFSTDIYKTLMDKAEGIQQVAQRRITVEEIAEKFGKVIDPTKEAPFGYVKISEALPEGTLEKIASRWDEGDKFLKAMEDKAIPVQWVKPITEMLSINSETPGAFMKTYDWALSILRPFMLSAPATQVRNFISSLFMGFAAGDYSNVMKRGNFWRSALYNLTGGKFGGDSVIDIMGKKYLLRDMWQDYAMYGGKSMSQTAREFAVKPPKGNVSKVLRGAKKASDVINTPMTKVAGAVEDTVRFNHYLNMLQQGASPMEAIESVALHFYDYADLSRTERNFFRRVFPFYTFFRKNMGSNLRYVLTNMGYASFPAKFARNVTRMTEGEEGTFPLEWLEQDRQKWLADQGAFVLPWNKKLMTLQGFLPQADIASILAPMTTGAKQVMSMVSPVAKLPYEIANNKDTFTGKELKNPIRQSTYFLGMDVDPRVAHAMRPFRILDTIDKSVKAMGPERAAQHGYTNPNREAATLGQRARGAAGDALAFRTYYENPEDVRLNKVMESSKWIRRIDQYLKTHPELAPVQKQKILRERERLAGEVARAGGED